MVTEMRGNSTYRLPAYVFYYGAEERRKENDRVKRLIAEQMETYKKNNIVPDEGITVRHRTVEVQYAVMLGGYPDAATAKYALERMRHLPAWTRREEGASRRSVPPASSERRTSGMPNTSIRSCAPSFAETQPSRINRVR